MTPPSQQPIEIQIASQLTFLEPGLHLFRLVIASNGQIPDQIGLSVAPIGNGLVEFFPGEGVVKNTLVKSGDCVVVRVIGQAAGVLITEYKFGRATNTAKIRIDRVATQFNGEEPIPSQNTRPGAAPPAPFPAPPNLPHVPPIPNPAAPQLSVRLLGHFTGRGDVIAANGLLGDPNNPQQIEGFAAIATGLPPGVNLTYACKVEGARTLQKGANGEFIGNRGSGRKITGVGFSLTGPEAKNFEICGAATFLGAPSMDVINGVMLEISHIKTYLVSILIGIQPKSSSGSPSKTAELTKEIKHSSRASPQKTAQKNGRVKNVPKSKARQRLEE